MKEKQINQREEIKNQIKEKPQKKNQFRKISQKKNNTQKRKNVKRLKTTAWLKILVITALVFFFLGKQVGQNQSYKQAVHNLDMEAYAANQQNEEIHNGIVQQSVPISDIEGKFSKEDIQEELEKLWKDSPELVLVNKDYKLPEDYEIELKSYGNATASALAYDKLVDMLKDGQKEGLKFKVCSSYRSQERQQELLDEDIEKLMKNGYTYREAYNEVTKETMPPGYSEHSTGLAFDIVSKGYQLLDKGQENTKENQWLRQHCAEYGFILRYPEEKSEITGINYESWHYRYVGVEVAKQIMEEGITLEEYLEEYVEENLEKKDGEIN